jgi:MG2 domain-containing protein
MILRKCFPGILMLFASLPFAHAQKKTNYQTAWFKVAKYADKGLTRSALNEAIKIYTIAVKEKNDIEQIKSCIYQIRYRNIIDENSGLRNLVYMDTLIRNATAPAKNILLSIKADELNQYLMYNNWRLSNRTTVSNDSNSDFTTWSIARLQNEVTHLYEASLTDLRILKATSLDGYDPIIVEGNTRFLRPTLYDLLAQRALSYYTSGQSYSSAGANSFTLDNERFFEPVAQFTSDSFTTKDTGALNYKAILLLHDILKFHLNDASPSALIDADLIRLDFVHSNAALDNKEELYEKALKDIEIAYPKDSVTAQAIYSRASMYYNSGLAYNSQSNSGDQYGLKSARDLCENIIHNYPGTNGAINASNLISEIDEPYLNIESEEVNIPGQPFRNLVSYKNIPKVHLRVFKISNDEIRALQDLPVKKYWKALADRSVIKQWNVDLPDPGDYRQHSTEIKTDALPNGEYMILVSRDADFGFSKNILAAEQVYISNISYINNDSDYYVVNRDNGQPIPNVKVQVWNNVYNNKDQKNTRVKSDIYTTDLHGHFVLTHPATDNRSIEFQFTTKQDSLYLDNTIYNQPDYHYYWDTPSTKPVTFLFTDRGIYRPGQTVYFKGIVTNNYAQTKKSDVIPKYTTTLQLSRPEKS